MELLTRVPVLAAQLPSRLTARSPLTTATWPLRPISSERGDDKRRYGARHIAEELADLGEVCSPRLVARILRNQGLRAIQPKRFVPKTTDMVDARLFRVNTVQFRVNLLS